MIDMKQEELALSPSLARLARPLLRVVDALEPEITRDTRKRERGAEDPYISVESFHKSREKKDESALFAVPNATPPSRCLIKCKRARHKLPYITLLPVALLLSLLLDVCPHRSFSSLFIPSIRTTNLAGRATWRSLSLSLPF